MSLSQLLMIIGIAIGCLIYYPVYRLFSSNSKNKAACHFFAFGFLAMTVMCFRFIATAIQLNDIGYYAFPFSWIVSETVSLISSHKKGKTYIEGALRGYIMLMVVIFPLMLLLTVVKAVFDPITVISPTITPAPTSTLHPWNWGR